MAQTAAVRHCRSPVSGVNGFSNSVSFTCSVQPSPALAPRCSINPNAIAPGNSASYTFSKSIDNGSAAGGGGLNDGSVDLGAAFDTSSTIGNQLSGRANRGVSDFDRTHYFVVSYVWDVPEPAFAHTSRAAHFAMSNWQLSGIVTAMSGLPIDMFDPAGGSLYGQIGARPNWATGANRRTAMSNVPQGYYFNPAAFAQAIVPVGSAIPSAHDSTALA